MGLFGDTAKLEKLVHKVENLASVPQHALKRIASGLADDIEIEMNEGHDPYGTSWAPLAPRTVAKGRTPPPLTDTHKMRESVKALQVRPSTVLITIDHPARPHQTGWHGRQGSGPARPLVPVVSQGMPDEWAETIQTAIELEFKAS